MIFDSNLNITTREREVLIGLSEGLTSKEIGEKLFLSEETIRWYRKSLLSKLNARSSFQLAIISVENGLIRSEFEQMA